MVSFESSYTIVFIYKTMIGISFLLRNDSFIISFNNYLFHSSKFFQTILHLGLTFFHVRVKSYEGGNALLFLTHSRLSLILLIGILNENCVSKSTYSASYRLFYETYHRGTYSRVIIYICFSLH